MQSEAYQDAYQKIADFGREILRHPNLDEALPIITDYARNVLNVERCSIFLHNPEHKILWTKLSDGIERIVLQEDQGIAGHTFMMRESLIVNDPYNDNRFMSLIDEKSGFVTRNVACVPIYGSEKPPIGVFQVLNKIDGDFDAGDARFVTFFSHFISGYLELSSIFDHRSVMFRAVRNMLEDQ